MPINGLTRIDDPKQLAPAEGLPYLGAIHLGQKRTDEMKANNQAGPDLDYFRIEFHERYEGLRGAFERIYGVKPTEFDPVLIFGHTAESAFPTWMAETGMKGSRTVGLCDGQQRVMWIDDRYNVHDTRRSNNTETPLKCRADGSGKCKFCKPRGDLRVLLLELYRQTGQYGYFFLTTSSKNNIARISAALVALAPLASLEGFAFRLGRTPGAHSGWRTYEKGGEVKLTETKHALLYLEPTAASAQKITAMLVERTGIALPALVGGLPELPAQVETSTERRYDAPPPADDAQDGDFEDVDEDDALYSEFYNCHSVYVGFDRESQGYYYVLRCDGAENFTVQALDIFIAAGLETASRQWATKEKVIKFDTPLQLFLGEDGQPFKLVQP